jgi:hypothetical protein
MQFLVYARHYFLICWLIVNKYNKLEHLPFCVHNNTLKFNLSKMFLTHHFACFIEVGLQVSINDWLPMHFRCV